jgi:glyceraldehyde-3-phosphate dehydrogenase type I
MLRIAINGFGRIGRTFLRSYFERYNELKEKIEIVAFNDLSSLENLAYLFKYDTTFGKFNGKVEIEDNKLIINGRELIHISEPNPSNLPWKSLDIDVVVEATGRFRTKELAQQHLNAGAKKVLLTAPPKSEGWKWVVYKVNHNKVLSKEDQFISNTSCTTNCLAPMVKVLHEVFGIKKGFMTTVHATTMDQRLLDSTHKDFRRGRSAFNNIVPTTTGAALSIGRIYEELNGKLDGISIRVPVKDGSLVDLVVELEEEVNEDEINETFKCYSRHELKGVLEYSEDPIVSSDIIKNPHSCIFDSLSTKVLKNSRNMVKVLGWYDNEYGYSNRLLDVLAYLNDLE